MSFENMEIPFIVKDNRRCITDQQIDEDIRLLAFIFKFRDCFDYDETACVWWYYD